MDFPLFIGFTHMESWLASIDKKQPVFATLITELNHESNDQRTERLVITVAQPVCKGEMVYYCRLPVGILTTTMYLPTNHDQALRIAENAFQLVIEWIIENHLVVHQGVIATPKNTQFLDGKAYFLEFDHQTQQYTKTS